MSPLAVDHGGKMGEEKYAVLMDGKLRETRLMVLNDLNEVSPRSQCSGHFSCHPGQESNVAHPAISSC
jgi:hypothetical protein